jgi:hypothetical protein
MNIGASLGSSRSGAFNAMTFVVVSLFESCVTMRSSVDPSAYRRALMPAPVQPRSQWAALSRPAKSPETPGVAARVRRELPIN